MMTKEELNTLYRKLPLEYRDFIKNYSSPKLVADSKYDALYWYLYGDQMDSSIFQEFHIYGKKTPLILHAQKLLERKTYKLALKDKSKQERLEDITNFFTISDIDNNQLLLHSSGELWVYWDADRTIEFLSNSFTVWLKTVMAFSDETSSFDEVDLPHLLIGRWKDLDADIMVYTANKMCTSEVLAFDEVISSTFPIKIMKKDGDFFIFDYEEEDEVEIMKVLELNETTLTLQTSSKDTISYTRQ